MQDHFPWWITTGIEHLGSSYSQKMYQNNTNSSTHTIVADTGLLCVSKSRVFSEDISATTQAGTIASKMVCRCSRLHSLRVHRFDKQGLLLSSPAPWEIANSICAFVQ